MEDRIQFNYVVEGKKYSGEISREKFLRRMKMISDEFREESDNEISSKLVEIIPSITQITVNQDRNDSMNDPFISYDKIDGEKCMLTIKRRHDIIWGFIKNYCYKVMK